MFLKQKNILIIIILAITLFSGTLCFLFFSQKTQAKITKENFVNGELLIKLKDNSKIYKIKDIDFDLKDWKEIVLKIPEIEWAEPNYLLKASYLPSDPYYHEQWYLDKIKAPQAWDLAKGGSKDIIIAILDTGVDIDHPDLKANIWANSDEIKGDGIDNDHNGYIDDFNGWDFIQRVPNPKPKFNEEYTEGGIHHGTLVSGIAAAVGNNMEGVVGVAWNSKIMPLRVLNSEGTGSIENVIQAVNYAVNNGAKIINLSFVGTNKSYFLAEALKQAWRRGVVIVAAAGNETTDEPVNLNEKPNYPICLDEDEENFIIGVAAVDNVDHKALFSDYGSNCVDISAPGTRIYGTLVYNPNYDFKEYYGGYWSGTSISAPIISGLAALVWSINPLFSHKQVQDFILDQADDIDSINPDFAKGLGRGRVNIYKSVEKAYNQLGGVPQNHYIITGAGKGGGPHVRVFDSVGSPISGFFAYNEYFRGGVKVAGGDVDGDGIDEIITGAGPSGGPHVRIFDLFGKPKGGFFAYDKNFRGGVSIAVGDVDGDGIDEIITGPGKGVESEIKVFDLAGNLQHSFIVYPPQFLGGANVATGDVDGDGIDEIITGAGPGGGPHVRVFDGQGNFKFHFFAFNKNFLGGVNVAVGDTDADNKDEIIVGVASGASSYIRVFNAEFLLLRRQFLAYSKDFYHGTSVAVADFDGDQQVEIISAAGPTAGPIVEIFDSLGNHLSQFYAYARHFYGGVNVATMQVK